LEHCAWDLKKNKVKNKGIRAYFFILFGVFNIGLKLLGNYRISNIADRGVSVNFVKNEGYGSGHLWRR
jgi:hypothetical protein